MPSNSAEYMRRYRQDNPQYTEEQKRKERAKDRALTKLRLNHKEEFHKLFKDELANDTNRT